MSERPPFSDFNGQNAGASSPWVVGGSQIEATPYGSSSRLAASPNNAASAEKPWDSPTYDHPHEPQRKSKRLIIIAVVAIVTIIIFLAVFLPVYFLVIRRRNATPQPSSSSSTPTSDSGSDGSPGNPLSLTVRLKSSKTPFSPSHCHPFRRAGMGPLSQWQTEPRSRIGIHLAVSVSRVTFLLRGPG